MKFYYNAGTGAGGGGAATPALPLSLSEIEANIAKNRAATPSSASSPTSVDVPVPEKKDDTIQTGTGDPKLPDITDPKNRHPAPEGKIYAPDGTLIDDPNFKKPDPNKIEVPAGKKLDADGKTLIDDPDYKPDVDPNAEPDDVNFWEEVEKVTGRKIEVKYPENVDPESVEGTVLREAAVRESAVAEWEQNLQERFPRAVAYMMHHMEGGSDDAFLNNERGVSLPERTVVESTVDVQTQFVRNDLIGKGVDTEVVDAQIAKLIKDNKIKDKSLAIYDAIKKGQEQELAQLQTRAVQEKTRVDSVINGMTSRLQKVLPDMGFIVPETERAKFMDFVMDNVQYDKKIDKFYIVQDLDIENPQIQLQMLYLKHMNGDLGKIAQKKIMTQAVQTIKIGAKKTKIGASNQPEDRKEQGGYVPLGQMGPGATKK